MEIDDFLQEKKANEAKERLEEAKRKLREEKEKLKEELRRQKDGNKPVHHPDSEEKQAKEPGEYTIKPWMLWNLIILALVAVLFIIAMLYPKGAAGISKEDVLKMVDEKSAKIDELIKALNVVKEDVRKLGATPIDSGSNQALDNGVNNALTSDTPKGLKDFILKIEDDNGYDATGGEIEANGTQIRYSIILQNLEDQNLKCRVNKATSNSTTMKEIGSFHVSAAAKEDITEELTNKGTTSLKFSAACAYAKLQGEKWVETSDYSKDIETSLILKLTN